jgi:hypothetical protein
VMARDFSLHYHVQTGCGVHTALYPVHTGGFIPGGKLKGA